MNFRAPIHQPPDEDEMHILSKLAERAAATGLAEVEIGTWYGGGALKVAGKGFAKPKDAETLVLFCASRDEKDILLGREPDLFFQTDHYRGSTAFLVRLDRIDDATLSHRLAQSWLAKAPPRLRKAFLALRPLASEPPHAAPSRRSRGSPPRPA